MGLPAVDAPLAAALVVNVLLLGLFAVQHSVMARPAFKRWWTRFVPKSVERSTCVLLASGALILLFWQWRPIPATVWQVHGAAAVALTTVRWAGWALVLASTCLIDHFELFGLKQVFARLVGRPPTAPVFRTPLFYRRVCHPICLGFLVAFWAAPTMCRTSPIMDPHRRQAHELTARARLVRLLVGLSLTAACLPTAAFVVVAMDQPNEYLKWGPSHRAGTPGGVVTWGILAAGTPGSSACGNYCQGNSLDALPHFHPTPERDNRTTPTSLSSLRRTIQAAFDAWSSVANVQFEYVGIDRSMKPVNDPTATSPQIRIGIYSFGGLWSHCLSGAAFAPPPNEGSIAGDIFFNANVGFQLSNAPEDSELSPFPEGYGLHMTDVYLIALHEIGHAIGLGDSSDTDSVLCGGDPSSASLRREYLWRTPRADDVAGAQFLYGPPSGSSRAGPAAETR